MNLNVSFKESDDKFTLNLEEEAVQIKLAFQEAQIVIHSETEPYEGEYTIYPSFETQTLDTAGKRMSDDLTINQIQVSKVSNPFGGNTVYIGG